MPSIMNLLLVRFCLLVDLWKRHTVSSLLMPSSSPAKQNCLLLASENASVFLEDTESSIVLIYEAD